MKSEFDRRLTGWLLTALVMISAEALAANGFTITTSRENDVAIGEDGMRHGAPREVGKEGVRHSRQPRPVRAFRAGPPDGIAGL